MTHDQRVISFQIHRLFGQCASIFDGRTMHWEEYVSLQRKYERDHQNHFRDVVPATPFDTRAKYFCVRDLFYAALGIGRPFAEDYFAVKKTLFAAYALVGEVPNVFRETITEQTMRDFLKIDYTQLQ